MARRNVILAVDGELNAVREHLANLGDKAPTGEVVDSIPLARLARDQAIVVVSRPSVSEPFRVAQPINVNDHWHASENGGEPNASTILRTLGPAVVPLTVKFGDRVLKLAYA